MIKEKPHENKEVPPRLIAHLKESGKMVIPVGPSYSQELRLIEKKRMEK